MAEPLFFDKLALLAKIETTRSVDASPAAADALLASDVTLTPLEGDEVELAYIRPYFGASRSVMTTAYRKLSFKVPFGGVAVAGALPAVAQLLRSCAVSATVSAGVKTTFAPVTDSIESLSVWCVIDRQRYKLLGAQGSMKVTCDAKGVPWWQVDLTGSWETITDLGSMPAVTLSGWIDPLPVNKANTTLSLHGVALVASAFTFDIGAQVKKRDMIGVDDVRIVGRKTVGSVTFEQGQVATKDWLNLAKLGTSGPLVLVHGQGATNTISIAGQAVALGKPTFTKTDGVLMVNAPLIFQPVSGNDEWSIDI